MKETVHYYDKNGVEISEAGYYQLQLRAVERERDELRLEIARIGGAKAIEVLRRDAAAGEPVAVISEDSLAELKQSYRPVLAFRPDHKRNSPGISLYTAAPPAVLPPPLDNWHISASGVMASLQFKGDEMSFTAGANWMRQQCLEMGAQQQKAVELHKRKSTEVISGQRYSYVLLEDLLPELDAANVKWEVKS